MRATLTIVEIPTQEKEGKLGLVERGALRTLRQALPLRCVVLIDEER